MMTKMIIPAPKRADVIGIRLGNSVRDRNQTSERGSGDGCCGLEREQRGRRRHWVDDIPHTKRNKRVVAMRMIDGRRWSGKHFLHFFFTGEVFGLCNLNTSRFSYLFSFHFLTEMCGASIYEPVFFLSCGLNTQSPLTPNKQNKQTINDDELN
jgi:hypothetical protein